MDVVDTDFYQPTPKEAEVWKVCDALLAEKKRITYQSIGERLLSQGLKRGSNTDICRYLASWKKHHYPAVVSKKSTQSPKAPSSPSINQNALNSIADHLQKIFDNQQAILKYISSSKSNPMSQSQSNQVVAILLDMCQKQLERETQYLKALEHAREIQTMLRQSLEKYRKQARMGKANQIEVESEL